MKIGVYCGSFAPVHKGHRTIIEETLKQNIADKVIVVPTGDYWDKKVAIPLEKRIACLKIYENEQVLIDDCPAHCQASCTYELLKLLQKRYPNDTLMLMLGADNLCHFEKWVKSRELLQNYPFIVMKRNDIDVDEQMKHLKKKNYFILYCEEINISSSWLRDHLDQAEQLKQWMDEPVIKILQNNI